MERPCAPQGLAHAYVPHHAGCRKSKISILHLEGGIPRGSGRRRRQSTAAWPKRPTEIFTSVSPLKGLAENFTRAPPLRADTKRSKKKMAVVPPYVRGTRLNVHYPFRGRFKFTFKVQVPGFPFRGSQAVLLPYTRSGAHATCLWPLRRGIDT